MTFCKKYDICGTHSKVHLSSENPFKRQVVGHSIGFYVLSRRPLQRLWKERLDINLARFITVFHILLRLDRSITYNAGEGVDAKTRIIHSLRSNRL